MRTMFIGNSLVTNGTPTAKGAIGLKQADGAACNFLSSAAITNPNALMEFIQSMGNGSIKTFTLNPLSFNFHTQLSGTANGNTINDIAAKYNITFPTGNAQTDSFGMEFLGGIVVKELIPDQNVYRTRKILSVNVVGTNGTVAVADVKAAFKAAMSTLTTYISSQTYAAQDASAEYVLTNANYYIELVGDLRFWTLGKTQGMSFVNTGADAIKFEKELAPNSGYSNTIDKVDGLYAESNFIADVTKVYDIITVETMTIAQRPLLPNAGGFPKVLHIYVDHDAKVAVFDKIVAFLTALRTANGGAVAL